EKKHGDDPLLPFCRGQVHALEGAYALADRAFVAGMARPPDPATLELFRSSRVLARYYTGHALDAHADIGPRDATFRQLVQLCLSEPDDALLAALLDAHGRVAPDSPALLRYRYHLKIRQNQLTQAVLLFKTALARADADDRP